MDHSQFMTSGKTTKVRTLPKQVSWIGLVAIAWGLGEREREREREVSIGSWLLVYRKFWNYSTVDVMRLLWDAWVTLSSRIGLGQNQISFERSCELKNYAYVRSSLRHQRHPQILRSLSAVLSCLKLSERSKWSQWCCDILYSSGVGFHRNHVLAFAFFFFLPGEKIQNSQPEKKWKNIHP